ncbi:tyrosine-protein phosphatase [Chondrinema litorale]|uniref:tyrosine-protein phosphatase n=1 Tax=Chondrinema litorale TaxID=2994555 RepID=UPI0025435080|nr:CpsB/CapC family capsule biosynthesis tyrosine phosphatase [Chondrinema litorale]UZR92445.1 capsular biosynthesis protein [Chondrinema litorale]
MFSIFGKKKNNKLNLEDIPQIHADMHSHVLPGLDDGSPNIETSLTLVKSLMKMGYKHLICTPHVMSDFYKNTPEKIKAALKTLREAVKEHELNVTIEASAEYYLDEIFIENLEKDTEFLSFGDHNYLLFETSFLNPSAYLEHAIFLMRSRGFQPILAHPERYAYFFNKYEKLTALKEKGVVFQVNINSLSGYYSKDSQRIAEKLIDDQLVSFLGTDCHNTKHIAALERSRQSPYFLKAYNQVILNNTLNAAS